MTMTHKEEADTMELSAKICKDNEWSCTAVTTVDIFQNHLFFGDGNYVSVYRIDGIALGIPRYYPVFPAGAIITKMVFVDREDEVHIMVFAGRAFRSIMIPKTRQGEMKTEEYSLSSAGNLDDTVLAGQWLGEGMDEVLLVGGNNNFHLLSCNIGITGVLSYEPFNEFQGESCILYSAEITGDRFEDIRIFVGTVFSRIEIYSLEFNYRGGDFQQQAFHMYTVEGHDGVIFSIKYYPDKGILLSTSDDRKVIVWNTSLESQAEVTKRVELIGHTARVFNSIVVGNNIISVGEDSTVMIWKNYDDPATCFQEVLPGHGGSSIRGCAYSHTTHKVFTSADNGSIYKWDLKNKSVMDKVYVTAWNESKEKLDYNTVDSKEFPRRVCLVNEHLVIATTNLGQICFLSDTSVNKEFADVSLVHYQALGVSHVNQMIAVGGMDGGLTVIPLAGYPDIEDSEYSQIEVPDKRKIMDVFFLPSNLLVSTQTEMYFYSLGGDMDKPKLPDQTSKPKSFAINTSIRVKSKRGQVSAVYEFGAYVILGYDTGELEAVNLEYRWRLKFSSRHTKYGVGDIAEHNSMIVTGGRDGKLRFFDPTPLFLDLSRESDISFKDIVVLEVRELELPFSWVGGLRLYQGSLIVLGFMSVHFVVYSADLQQILITTNCGGAHRSWDFHITDNGHGTLVYLKDQKIHNTSFELNPFFDCIVKEGVQKKQINCVAPLKPQGSTTDMWFASGSEDCSVEIFQMYLEAMVPEEPAAMSNEPYIVVHLEKLDLLTHHTSAVRAISFASSSPNSGVMATGGGKSEVFLVPILFEEMECHVIGKPKKIKFDHTPKASDFRVMQIASIYAHVPWRHRSGKEHRHERSMFFAFVACSDGAIRIVREDGLYRLLVPAMELSIEKHSMQCVDVNYDSFDGSCMVHGGRSDGKIFTWTLNLKFHETFLDDYRLTIPYVASYQISAGDSAITAMKISSLAQDKLRYLVGYDSGTLAMCSRINTYHGVFEREHILLKLKPTLKCRFTGAITSGIDFIADSNDNDKAMDSIMYAASTQTVLKYRFREDGTSRLIREVNTGVPDCKGMLYLSTGGVEVGNESFRYMLCFGDGLRVFAL